MDKFWILLIFLSLTSCKRDFVTLKGVAADAKSKAKNAKVTNVRIENNQLKIDGLELKEVSEVIIKNNFGFSRKLIVQSSTKTSLIATALEDISILVGGAFSLVLADAHGSATYQVGFDLQNGAVDAVNLSDMGASDGDLLVYDQGSGQWGPGQITGLSVPDNTIANVIVAEGPNSYIEVDTTNTNERINFGANGLKPDYYFTGGTLFHGDTTFSMTGFIPETNPDINLIFDNTYDVSGFRTANKIALFNANSWRGGFGVSSGSVDLFSGGNFNFYNGHNPSVQGTNSVSITNGRLGVNNNSPDYALDVESSATTNTKLGAFMPVYITSNWPVVGFNTYYDGAWKFGAGSTTQFASAIVGDMSSGGISFYTSPTGGAEGANTNLGAVAKITAGGDFGIGTLNPSYKLEVNGSVAGVGAYNNLSDIRLKTGIRKIENASEKLQQLSGVYYIWRHEEFPEYDFPEGEDMGVIAQEVERLFPHAVTVNKKGIKSVAYSKLIAPLIQATNEQSRMISSLEDENKKLKEENEQLQKRLLRIEKALNLE